MIDNDLIVNNNDLLLVTGSNGFIGAKVVETLLSYGFTNIRCFVRPSSNLTNLERIMRQELERRNLEFIQFYPVRSGFILDFAFPEQKLEIECDGEKWHLPGNKKDRFRDWILKRTGWKVLRFREADIINDISKCVDNIESHLKPPR